jgi:hypothetical protein
MGQTVYRENAAIEYGVVQIETLDIASGTYTILLTTTDKNYRLPVIIQH